MCRQASSAVSWLMTDEGQTGDVGRQQRRQEVVYVTSTGSRPLHRARPSTGTSTVVPPLYRGLQPRWSGLDSEEVAAHQRRRLYGAVIEAAGGRGYQETSVSELARMAGVSKRTLYERFDNKEGLLLASLDVALARAVAHVRRVFLARSGAEDALGAAFGAFLQLVRGEPGLARLTLIDAVKAGPAAASRIERGRRGFEGLLAASIRDSDLMPRSLLKAIVGGVEQTTRAHLVRGDVLDPLQAGVELARWVSCYDPRIAAMVGRWEHRLDRTSRRSWNVWLREGDDRTRLMRAAAAIAGREGYEALDAVRIARLARLPADALDSCFESADACFLATLDLLCAEALGVSARAAARAEDWTTGLVAGLSALMEHLAVHPVLARVAFVEALAPAALPLEGALRAFMRFAGGFAKLVPSGERTNELTGMLTVGAVWTLIHHCVARDAKHLLPAFSGHVAFISLAPAVGAEAAITAIREFETSGMQKPQAPKGRHSGADPRS